MPRLQQPSQHSEFPASDARKMASAESLTRGVTLATLALAMCFGVVAHAAEEEADSAIEVITVTAEKREQSIQDTPIAVSAFDEAALDTANIANAREIQFAVPNTLFSRGNFAGYNFAIRGIGNLAVAQSSDSGTGIHYNSSYQVVSTVFEENFLDVERIEVLRGPQGTLYGRNTTAGVLNIITAKPVNDFAGRFAMRLGNYGEREIEAASNLAVIPSFLQLRLAAKTIERDGVVENLFTGDSIDDRDLRSWRFSARIGGEPDDPFSLVYIHHDFEEDDSRMRTSKQLCHRQTDLGYPHNLGCFPNRSLYSDDAFQTFTSYSTLAGYLSSAFPSAATGTTLTPFVGSLGVTHFPGPNSTAFGVPGPLAYSAASDPLSSANNPSDLRTVNSAINPYYFREDTIEQYEFKWDLGAISLHANRFDQEDGLRTNTDYNWTTGSEPFNRAAILTFNSVNAARLGDSLQASDCSLANPTAATCVLVLDDPRSPGGNQSTDPNRSAFSVGWDESAGFSSTDVSEVRILTDFDAWFNFMIGAFEIDYFANGWYEVHASALQVLNGGGAIPDSVAANFNCPLINPLDSSTASCDTLGFFRSHTLYTLTSEAQFGEIYFTGENVRLTLGYRTSDEVKRVQDRQTLLNDPTLPFVAAVSNSPYLPNNPASWQLVNGVGQIVDPITRQATGTSLADNPANVANRRLGFGTGATSDGVGNNAVPAFSDRSGQWSEPSYKVGLDFYLGDRTLLYLTYSNSYKSGGLNPPALSGAFPATFGPEYIDSVEIGIKTSGERTVFNLTAFMYDFEGLQISRIVDRTSVNDNINAEIMGAELEFQWSPSSSWLFSATASYLDTEITGGFVTNTADPANYYRSESVASGGSVVPRFLNTKTGAAGVFLTENPVSGYVFDPNDCDAAVEGGLLVCANVYTVNPYELYLEQQAGAASISSQIESIRGAADLSTPFTVTRTNEGAITMHDFVYRSNDGVWIPDSSDSDNANVSEATLAAGVWEVVDTAGTATSTTIASDGFVYASDGSRIFARNSAGNVILKTSGLPTREELNTLTTQVPIGIAVDLAGNSIPNAPETSINLAANYLFDFDGARGRLRLDYYWQDDFYYRVYNTQQDLIRQWQVWNASLAFTAPDNSWEFEVWAKNLADYDNITGAYFTDASSGNFTNVFLLEPFTFGIAVTLNY